MHPFLLIDTVIRVRYHLSRDFLPPLSRLDVTDADVDTVSDPAGFDASVDAIAATTTTAVVAAAALFTPALHSFRCVDIVTRTNTIFQIYC